MSEMIERVAKAIYEEDDPWHKAWPWPDLNEKQGSADAYRRIATAAIKAMREPTEAMLDAASIAYYRKSNDMYSLAPTEEPDAGGGPFGYAFRAAIDAALVGEVG